MNLGALGLPAYRTFSLEELEIATNNFDTTAFMGEGSQGQKAMVDARLHGRNAYRLRLGVAKGIQFLYTGLVPGVYSNHLKITNILMDQNFVAKISSYNLPLLAENVEKGGHGTSAPPKDPSTSTSVNKGASKIRCLTKTVTFGFGSMTENQVQILKNQLKAIMATEDTTRRRVADPAVRTSCSDQSLKTMMEICVRCVVKEPAGRPSVDDVVWNLQFAAQVEDAWSREGSSSSPGSPFEPPHLRFAFH
ncbi:hypothetical protein V6N11_019184 [Hibiscus sabdariffa]|uniref:Uncharacterized protein n=1 Tax=Hibiscus sabdariffa TaxID=183260 RepID=A0ABR2R1M0_9ROSI